MKRPALMSSWMAARESSTIKTSDRFGSYRIEETWLCFPDLDPGKRYDSSLEGCHLVFSGMAWKTELH